MALIKTGRNDPCPCGSGRKYKQCCLPRDESRQTTGRIGDARAAQLVSESLRMAMAHHRAGRLGEAEVIYNQILQTDPKQTDALHLLGLIAHQTGNSGRAVELIERAARSKTSDPGIYNNLGLAYRGTGRLDDAIACYQKALSLKPDFAEAHSNLGNALKERNRLEDAVVCYRKALSIDPALAEAHGNLGAVLKDLGRLEEAVVSCRKALAINPDFAQAHNSLGNVLREQNKPDEAMACYRQALAANPEFAEAHGNLGDVHRDQGRLDEAVASYRRALAAKPDYSRAQISLGNVLREQGRLDEAITCCQKAIQTDPSDRASWVEYLECLKQFRPEVLDQIDQATLLLALRKGDLDPQPCERAAAAFICRDPQVMELLRLADDPAQCAHVLPELLGQRKLGAFFEMPLLLAVLEETINTSHRLERLLTIIRRELLARAARSDTATFDQSAERFAASLALQCFANEYVYAETDEEREWVSSLTSGMAASVQKGETFPPARALLVAAYLPLYRLDCAERLASLFGSESHLQGVIERQLLEPMEEKRLESGIPRLTKIDDDISRAVRQQYEENPYPRWRRRSILGEPKAIHVVLRSLFPGQDIAATSPGRPEILIAGCGTGSQSIQAAWRFSNARILAVDLSLASLAYAKRATSALGISNIDYRQADILQLGVLDNRFDLIESTGVLHHMSDPIAGWGILCGRLRPGGYMKIALYSRRARGEIAAARRRIDEHGHVSTPAGIRLFRQEWMMADSGFADSLIGASRDFYSTSTCRDLLFHVQEHLFSPAEIQVCLDQLGLKFLGFELLPPAAKKRYLARFPLNPACDSLANWELFERDNPATFAGMYQFWVRKIGDAVAG